MPHLQTSTISVYLPRLKSPSLPPRRGGVKKEIDLYAIQN